jgi:hypothetical protein
MTTYCSINLINLEQEFGRDERRNAHKMVLIACGKFRLGLWKRKKMNHTCIVVRKRYDNSSFAVCSFQLCHIRCSSIKIVFIVYKCSFQRRIDEQFKKLTDLEEYYWTAIGNLIPKNLRCHSLDIRGPGFVVV